MRCLNLDLFALLEPLTITPSLSFHRFLPPVLQKIISYQLRGLRRFISGVTVASSPMSSFTLWPNWQTVLSDNCVGISEQGGRKGVRESLRAHHQQGPSWLMGPNISPLVKPIYLKLMISFNDHLEKLIYLHLRPKCCLTGPMELMRGANCPF